MELGANACNPERMVNELLAGAPCLSGMCALGEFERAAEKILVDARVVRLDLGDQLLDEVVMVSLCVEDAHEVSVLSRVPDPFSG